jgi:hypothetical protein
MVNFDQILGTCLGILRTMARASTLSAKKSGQFAVILAIVGVLLVSSGVAPVGTIGPANAASPASAANAKPLAARSRPEVQMSVVEDGDRAAALGLLLLLRGMSDGRRGW